MNLAELLQKAQRTLALAEASAKKGHVASCSYELEVVQELVRDARKSCIAKIRSDRAREEATSPLYVGPVEVPEKGDK